MFLHVVEFFSMMHFWLSFLPQVVELFSLIWSTFLPQMVEFSSPMVEFSPKWSRFLPQWSNFSPNGRVFFSNGRILPQMVKFSSPSGRVFFPHGWVFPQIVEFSSPSVRVFFPTWTNFLPTIYILNPIDCIFGALKLILLDSMQKEGDPRSKNKINNSISCLDMEGVKKSRGGGTDHPSIWSHTRENVEMIEINIVQYVSVGLGIFNYSKIRRIIFSCVCPLYP